MRYPPRLPRVPIEVQPNPLNLSSAASKEGVFTIYGGESGNKALSIYDGSTVFLSIDPDNSITTGKHIGIKATPEASSAATIMEIEADGSNWGTGSCVLKLISDDTSCRLFEGYMNSTMTSLLTTTGVLFVSGGVNLRSSGLLTTESSTDIILKPNGTGITIIGDAGSTSNSLAANDDLLVTGKLEVDGSLYCDDYIYANGHIVNADNKGVYFGNGLDAVVLWSTAQATSNNVIFALADISKSIVYGVYTNRLKDYDHAAQSNPTIFVHSATDPDTANTQWLSMYHNQTDGVIDVGLGTLNLGSGGHVVNFVGSSVTGSTVTHDAYCEIEVAGVLKKFMLGS